jgi:hypothetical protein
MDRTSPSSLFVSIHQGKPPSSPNSLSMPGLTASPPPSPSAIRFNKHLPQSKDVLVNPYPPQPVFKCPDWRFVFDEGNPLPHLIPKADEISIAPLGLGPVNVTWTPNSTGTWSVQFPS